MVAVGLPADGVELVLEGGQVRAGGIGFGQDDPDVEIGVVGLGHGADAADGVDGLDLDGVFGEGGRFGGAVAEMGGGQPGGGQVGGLSDDARRRGRAQAGCVAHQRRLDQAWQHFQEGRPVLAEPPSGPGQAAFVVGEHGQSATAMVAAGQHDVAHRRDKTQPWAVSQGRGQRLAGLGRFEDGGGFVPGHRAQDVGFVGGTDEARFGEIAALGAHA